MRASSGTRNNGAGLSRGGVLTGILIFALVAITFSASCGSSNDDEIAHERVLRREAESRAESAEHEASMMLLVTALCTVVGFIAGMAVGSKFRRDSQEAER